MSWNLNSRLLSRGDLVDWETASWKQTNTIERHFRREGICKIQNDRIHVPFTFPRTMPRLRLICSALNGTVSIVDEATTHRDLFGLLPTNWTSLEVEGLTRKDHVWVGWTGILFSVDAIVSFLFKVQCRIAGFMFPKWYVSLLAARFTDNFQ